jgi:FAD/FMN-containing dehydrogenase
LHEVVVRCSITYMSVLKPSSEEEIIAILKECASNGKNLRVIGAGKSLNASLGDANYQMSMACFDDIQSLNIQDQTVCMGAGVLIEKLCEVLWDSGFTLSGLGSVNGQTVGGIIANGTHSQGVDQQNFAANVAGIRLIDGLGNSNWYSEKTHPDIFKALPVSFGCLGVMTEFELKVIPRFHVTRDFTYTPCTQQNKTFAGMLQHGQSLMRIRPDLDHSCVYSVSRCDEKQGLVDTVRSYESYFMNFADYKTNAPIGYWRKAVLQLKRIFGRLERRALFGHPPPVLSTTEYAIPLSSAVEAMTLLTSYLYRNYPLLTGHVGFRSTKADDLWLSHCYGTDVCYVGLYIRSPYNIEKYMQEMERMLVELKGRPHWGKPFNASLQSFEDLYPRWNDFKKLRRQMDPNGIFENQWSRSIFV